MPHEQGVEFDTPEFTAALESFPPHVQEVVNLAARLCKVPGITVPHANADFDEVLRTHTIAREFAEQAGLRVIELPADPDTGKPYPYLMVTFPDFNINDPNVTKAVALIGHTDVVGPSTKPPNGENQFSPYLLDGDLYARGSADMKTVVATYLVWMAERQKQPGPKPPLIAMISSCEENGSAAPNHTGAALDWLKETCNIKIRFAVVGERTGELEWMDPDIAVGPICKENRAWRWMELTADATWDTGNGRNVLRQFSQILGEGRTFIQELNGRIAPERREAQPGLSSGFVNPYVLIGPDHVENGRTAKKVPEGTWVSVRRISGEAQHSATVSASNLSLIEQFEMITRATETRFGEERTYMGEVVIGEKGNFNSWDGSGRLGLIVRGASIEEVRTFMEREVQGFDVRIEAAPPETLCDNPGVAGMDIRELLEHKNSVETWLRALRRIMRECIHDILARPPWECPADDPDLMALEAAYEDVVGVPSPNLVKVHGNDGGELARREQEANEHAAETGIGHAVVFGQVGKKPHGKGESHRVASIAPYWKILDHWADALTA